MPHDDQSHVSYGQNPHLAPSDGGHGGQGFDARLHGGLDAPANPPPPGASDLH